MEVRKGYKQTEIGEIPEEWEMQPLKNGISLFSGHHVLAQYCNTRGEGTPYLTGPADYPNGIINLTKYTTKPTTICINGDILVTVKGSGSGSLVVSNDSYCISRQLMAIRAIDWDRSFIFYSLLENSTNIKAASTGLIPGLSRSDILEQLLPIPPLPEQKAIATALSDVDALIQNLEKLITKKRAIKTATMQQLLTGKRRLPGFGKGKGYKQTELGMIPEDWEVSKISDHFEFRNGLNKAKEYFGYGTPIVNYMDVFKNPGIWNKNLYGKVNVSNQEIKNYSVRRGDVFFTRTSETVDEIGVSSVFLDESINTVFSGFILRARPKTQELIDDFKKYCFSSNEVRKQITSTASYTTRALTNGRLLGAVIIAIPSKDEQQCISNAISDMTNEISKLESKLKKTKSIKQGMMQELLTGRTRLV